MKCYFCPLPYIITLIADGKRNGHGDYHVLKTSLCGQCYRAVKIMKTKKLNIIGQKTTKLPKLVKYQFLKPNYS